MQAAWHGADPALAAWRPSFLLPQNYRFEQPGRRWYSDVDTDPLTQREWCRA